MEDREEKSGDVFWCRDGTVSVSILISWFDTKTALTL